MRTFTIAVVAALLMSLVTFDEAFAYWCVPEIDAHEGLSAIALLVCLGVVLYSRGTKLTRG